MFTLLLVAASVGFANCAGLPIAEPLIIGGEHAEIDDVPYLASVRLKNEHMCGGVILSPNKILTTARCLSPNASSPDYHSVRVGSTHAHKNGGQLRSVSKVTQHPKFQTGHYDYDIGIITLSSPLVLGDREKAVATVLAPQEPFAGERLLVSGFGWVDNGRYKKHGLRALRIPVVSKDECNKDLEQYLKTKVSENMFCAGSRGKTIYTYDFGGPAVNSKKQLVGIGLMIAEKNFWRLPAVFMSVNGPEIRKFINENLA